jgi:hypothetical protein
LIPKNLRSNDEQQFYDALTKFREETKMPLTGMSEYRKSPERAKIIWSRKFRYKCSISCSTHLLRILMQQMAQEAAIMRDLARRQKTPTDENGTLLTG